MYSLSFQKIVEVTNNLIKKNFISLNEYIINENKIIDYFFIFFIGAFPIFISYSLNISYSILGEDRYIFKGYWDSYNWTSLVLILPVSLFLLRYFCQVVYGTPNKNSKVRSPPIANLFTEKNKKNHIHRLLRNSVRNHKRSAVVFVLTLAFGIIDSFNKTSLYVFFLLDQKIPVDLNPKVFSWSNAFFIQEIYPNSISISALDNFLFYSCTQICEFCTVYISMMAIALALNHNIIFLRLIFQRSRNYKICDGIYFAINFEDREGSFGLRCTHEAFNLQMILLFISGCLILFTRFSHSPSIKWPRFNIVKPHEWFIEVIDINTLSQLFPDFGQIIAAIAWIFAFFVVLLPSIVKFLPVFSSNIRVNGLGITSYLKEYIPLDKEEGIYLLEDKINVDKVAKLFHKNSFWPGGDSIAKFMLYFVSFIFLIIIFPISFSLHNIIYEILFMLIVGVSISNFILWSFRSILGHIDPRLIGLDG